jgi:hypothetical protein
MDSKIVLAQNDNNVLQEGIICISFWELIRRPCLFVVVSFVCHALNNWQFTVDLALSINYYSSLFLKIPLIIIWMCQVEWELLTTSEHLGSSPVLLFILCCGVHVAQSLVFCVVFRISLLSFLLSPLYCLSVICCFWLHLWYFQTFLMTYYLDFVVPRLYIYITIDLYVYSMCTNLLV